MNFNFEVVFAIILAAALLFILFFLARMLLSKRHPVVVAFFSFAIACFLFSTLYWIAYDLLQPKVRMPIAANEICEFALFLLTASSLKAAFPTRLPLKTTCIPAALFAAANAALWIAWSGEWVQDILTGISLGWFLCVLLACLLQCGAFSRAEWAALGAVSFLLIVGQTMTFLLPSAAQTFDRACYVVLFAGDFLLILKAVHTIRKRRDPLQGLCLSFAAWGWAMTALYMSAGWAYDAALFVVTLCCLLMFWAIKKEVGEE